MYQNVKPQAFDWYVLAPGARAFSFLISVVRRNSVICFLRWRRIGNSCLIQDKSWTHSYIVLFNSIIFCYIKYSLQVPFPFTFVLKRTSGRLWSEQGQTGVLTWAETLTTSYSVSVIEWRIGRTFRLVHRDRKGYICVPVTWNRLLSFILSAVWNGDHL